MSDLLVADQNLGVESVYGGQALGEFDFQNKLFSQTRIAGVIEIGDTGKEADETGFWVFLPGLGAQNQPSDLSQ